MELIGRIAAFINTSVEIILVVATAALIYGGIRLIKWGMRVWFGNN